MAGQRFMKRPVNHRMALACLLDHQEETGPSSCFAGDCPAGGEVLRDRTRLDVTCRDLRRAIDRWDTRSVMWRGRPGEFNACGGAAQTDEATLSVSVFAANRLDEITDPLIDPSDLSRYRSAVLISLTELP